MAGQGMQQGSEALGIAAAIIHPLHVHLTHLLQIVAGGAAGGSQGPIQLGGPAPSAHQLGEIRHRQPRISAAGRLPLQQRRQRHPALASTALAKGHGPQAQKGETAGTGMAIGLIGRHGRAGEQELARLRSRIHRPAHLVPEGWLHLPFIQQTRPGSRQHKGRIHRQRLAGGDVHIQQHRGGGQLLGHAGLAAGLGPLDHHRAGGSQAHPQLGISDTGAVGSARAGGHGRRRAQRPDAGNI